MKEDTLVKSMFRIKAVHSLSSYVGKDFEEFFIETEPSFEFTKPSVFLVFYEGTQVMLTPSSFEVREKGVSGFKLMTTDPSFFLERSKMIGMELFPLDFFR